MADPEEVVLELRQLARALQRRPGDDEGDADLLVAAADLEVEEVLNESSLEARERAFEH